MRIISLITAIAVVAILYVLVFERDVLQDFSKGKKIEEIADDLSDGIFLIFSDNKLNFCLGHLFDMELRHIYLMVGEKSERY